MTTETVANNAPETNSTKRSSRLFIAGGVFGLIAIAALVYYFMIGRFEEDTENAYVGGNIVAINAQTAGTVEAILADDNQEVKAGDPLVKLNPVDAQTALANARAQLSQTVRQIQQSYNGVEVARAQAFQADVGYKAAQHGVKTAEVAVATARSAVNRRAPLVKTGAVSREEFENAKNALTLAENTLAQAQAAAANASASIGVAKAQSQTAVAQVAGTDLPHHPVIESAKAAFRTAFINNKRLSVVAPMDGIVAKRFVQVGQQITPGVPLMNLVAASQVWVDANFKETQLSNLRVGQPVELKADMYGSSVKFEGKVQGIAIGTGSAFSLLPAQNATGNWIKIVQRVPVRILLNTEQLKKSPLRVGMSMTATVNTRNRDGSVLGAENGSEASKNLQTTVYAQDEKEADDEAMKIIQSNLKR